MNGLPGRMEKTIRRIEDMYIDDIFFDRDHEVEDRANMFLRYRNIINKLEKIASQIESPRESAGTKKFSKISLVSSN